MPSIIPTAPAAPSAPYFPQDRQQGVPLFTNAAGTTLYARNVGTLLLYGAKTFRNAGTIFNEIDAAFVGVTRAAPNNGIDAVENSGTIVFRGNGSGPGVVNSVQVFDEIRSLTNSGQIWAIAVAGSARAIQSFYQTTINNSGLIAVQAGGETALGIVLANGGNIVNTASGTILAEGKTSVAVRIDIPALSGVELDNAGRIEGRGTDGTNGIGVYLAVGDLNNRGSISGEIGVAGAIPTIVNTGTISGNVIAISATESLLLTNAAGGVITGRIEAGSRVDRIDNAGMIDGSVRTYDGDDVVTNTTGARITGIVDLGLGNDRYIGSDGSDRVAPDNGNDILDGAGGNDLLLGGNGDDRLIGGTGNDGLYGENGNDVIVMQGGDEAFGGANDDRFELVDLTFARIDGGSGLDTVLLPTAVKAFDLSAALASGRVTGIEAFELRGGGGIVVRAADAVALVPTGALRIDGGSSERVDLVGGWTAGATENGYVRYTAGSGAVLVKAGIAIGIAAAPPANATGLDAVAGGGPALRPGAETGLQLTPDGLYVVGLAIIEPTVIPTTDIWFTDGKVAAITSLSTVDAATLTVKGTLIASNAAQATAIAADFPANNRVVVEGSVIAQSTGAIERTVPDGFPVSTEGAYAIRDTFAVVNSGLVGAYSKLGMAVAMGAVQIIPGQTLPNPFGGTMVMPDQFAVQAGIGRLDNTGRVEAVADASWAIGFAAPADLTNSGTIAVTGAKGAIGGFVSAGVVNSGSIVATSAGRSYGLLIGGGGGDTQVKNTGLIEAGTALWIGSGSRALLLDNGGTIRGDIRVADGADRIVNTKSITGATWLGGGNDVFDGSLGTQGILYGEGGNDTLTGGAGDDVLMGGAGDDVLDGRGGNDVAVFAGTLSQYAVSFGADVVTVTSITEGIDRVSNIESFRFGSASYTLAELRAALVPATPLPAPIVRAFPADGATGVSPVANLTLAFAGAVTRGSGTIVLARADGTIVETFDAATSTRLTLSGNLLTIDPVRALTPGTGYTLTIAGGAIGVGGAPFAATSAYDFTTAAAAAAVADQFLHIATAGTRMTVTGHGQAVGDAGMQDVTVADMPARITFDGSFNLGGDRIRLPGEAANWTMRRSGSSAELTDGDTTVSVPVGLAGTELLFADGARTLLFDAASATMKLGAQSLTTTATPISAAAVSPSALGTTDAGIASQLALLPGGKALAMSDAMMIAGTAAAETVTLRGAGAFTLDASFNQGNDTIVLPGVAGAYSARVSGSSLILEGAVAEVGATPARAVQIPIGIAGTTLRFADGDHVLRFDPGTQEVKLGTLTIARSATALVSLASTAVSLDRDDDGNLATVFTIDASGGNFRFLDTAATSLNVRLTGFGAGDRLILDGRSQDYVFSSSGSDLIVTHFGSGGAVSTTTIVGLVDASWFVNSAATAIAAAGIDFLVTAP